MAQHNDGKYRGFKAAADLTGKQYYAVKITAANTVNLASAATDLVIGTLEEEGKSGDTVNVCVGGPGTHKVKLGGTVSIGSYLVSDANGKAVAATQASAGAQPTNKVFGQALEAGVNNDVIEYRPVQITF